jgi:hypothetical protein
MIVEKFRIINNYPNYDISNFGVVRNRNTGRLLSGSIGNHGYPSICLSSKGTKNTLLIHRLVAQAFIDNPNEYDCIDHIDRVKTNNHYKNLRWATHSMNMRNRKSHGKVDITGISFGTRDKCYRVTINDDDGKRITKHFAVSKYGNKARALQYAKMWRLAQERKYGYLNNL